MRAYDCRDPWAADIFSLGVILFTICVGHMPYIEDEKIEGINFDLIVQSGDMVTFWESHKELLNHKVSFDRSFKSLFEGMIDKDPKKRASIKEIKESEWYKREVYD